MPSPRLFKLNVGGTRFEVSDSLLNQYPNSMLRRLTSEAWNSNDTKLEDGVDEEEIFIERNGLRFQYVLDYMRDMSVSLPLAIPRAQFIVDLEYYNIDYDDSKILLSIADPKDLFYDLANYRDFFAETRKDIDKRLREVVIEKVACELASEYFERIGRPGRLWRNDSDYMIYMQSKETAPESVNSIFAATELRLPTVEAPRDISVDDIRSLMEKEYGLDVTRTIEKREKSYGREKIIYSEDGVSLKLSRREE